MEASKPFDLVKDAPRITELQEGLLNEMIRLVGVAHPYYREKMAEVGIDPGSFDGFASLSDFPLTSKEDFVGDPERFRLDLGDADAEEAVLWDVAYTSGTSGGRPTPIFQTAHDFRNLMLAQARMAEIRGMSGEDRIVNLYPMTPLPHGAWLRCNQAAAAIGASVVSTMSGRPVGRYPIVRPTNQVLEIVERSDPTVLWGVPSYVRRIMQAVAERGVRLPHLRMVALSGEPCTPGMRQSLEALAGELGADDQFVVSDSLGATELQCGLVECVPGAGFHNPAPELFHLAAVDEDGNPTADGATGRFVLTHLDRRGTVLLRFLLGDRVTFTNEPCPHCGRGGGRVVRHHGRTGRFAKVRGNLVDLSEMAKAIAAVSDVVEFQIVIRHPNGDSLGLDELVCRVVVDDAGDGVAEAVQEAVGRASKITPVVEIVDLDVIWANGPDMKPPRVLDLRQHQG